MILKFEFNEKRLDVDAGVTNYRDMWFSRLILNERKNKKGVESTSLAFKPKKKKGTGTLCIAFNAKEKSTLTEALFSNGFISNFKYSTTILCDSKDFILPKRITAHHQFVDHMVKKELFTVIFEELKGWEISTDLVPKYKDCLMVEKNFAWIAKDSEGFYRYFSKAEGGYTVGFSLFDLIQLREMIGVGTAIGQANARRVLVDLMQLQNYKEMEWEKKMINKINKNQLIIGNSQIDMKKYQPSLYKLVKPYLMVLGHVNTVSLQFLSGDKDHSVKGEATFFLSGYLLADLVSGLTDEKKFGQDRISVMINLFCSLGLINKIKEKDIPKGLFETATQYKTEHREFRNVNFFTLSEYTPEVLKLANDRAKILIDNDITHARLVTEKTIEKTLGKVVAKAVYGIKSPLTDDEKMVKERKAKIYHGKKEYYDKKEQEETVKKQNEEEEDDELCFHNAISK